MAPTEPAAPRTLDVLNANKDLRHNAMAAQGYPASDGRFIAAAGYFAIACKAARRHDALAAASLAYYGDHGPDVSGCVRDHFPDHVKESLRGLAKMARDATELGYAARPRRARESTMRKLSRQIATVHGSGFYGPQPFKESN